MLGLHAGSIVPADTLVELLWGDDPPRTAAKALQTHISLLRRKLGDGFVLTQGTGWIFADSDVDATRYKSAARLGRDAAAAGDTSQAVAHFDEALALWRGTAELPDSRRGISEKTRWLEGHAALVEDRADALLATGRAAEMIGDLEAAVTDAPLRERRWGQLMLALYRAGRQGEALAAYQRARALLADELGVDPGPNLRRLEAAIVAQDAILEMPVTQQLPSVTRAVTFLLTDIEGSTAAWEADADAMAVALARHDELVEQVVTSRGGRLIKTRGEGDATFSVFERPSAAAAAAIELQEAIADEPWALREPMRIRVALHTGEAELRDGDYFGRAVNRAARLRSLAAGGQILCSGATAELVVDSLRDDVVLADLGMRQMKNLARPEHVFELRVDTAEVSSEAPTSDAPIDRPALPAVLGGQGPFVGRGHELEQLLSVWQSTLGGGTNAILIAGEPGVGKTRLAGEWSRQAYDQGALVIYGRCDEDLGAPYQPFAEALRSLVPCLGADRLRGLRGVEALLALVPGLTDVLPDLAAPTRADPDTERYALFDAVVAVLGLASASAPVVLILDDLHWAAKSTLLLLRHLLRFGEQARVQIVGTYRSTDLDRSHPLAATLADLHRDGTANRLALSGLDEDDVTAYVAEAGYDDEELARALASVTGGNPFFLIEALRHVEESGGHWDPSTLPQGVREAVSRRLTRLPEETNKALAAAAVVGSRFGLELVERVVGDDLVDAFDEACKAGIVIEESSGRYRFNHALVRQSLLAELPSVRRLRLHQRIAATLETEPGADDELLAEVAYHYFECAWAGNAVKAVEYCRRAADQAMARLAYEGAADFFDRALHALEEIDDELPDREDQIAAVLIARCEALLAAGDVTAAAGAVAKLQEAARDSARLAAWATCFDGQLSMLVHPERLDEIEGAVGAAAGKLAELDDAAGEAMAHTVRATCLHRLGRIGDCEIALDDALTAARRAREHRRVNAVLANAPLAALWGPNPVPRAGGRCLDVVRLLRITTDSPAVEATSTRCQAVLEAFRGRGAAARRMIDSARRTVTELGLRHALVEVEQFAGIVELVVGDLAAAEAHLRKAYNGFRRMGLDADTAETAALLGRTCLALDRAAEADELCTESERLAGHGLKASIAWRTLRARLLSRDGHHDEARRVADAAVSLAERTDALVDHGDACLTLATVLGAAGNAAGARAAAERAADLYERKGAVALAERARLMLGERVAPPAAAPPEPPAVEPDTACVRVIRRAEAAANRESWDELAALYAPDILVESRRKITGFTQRDLASGDWGSVSRRGGGARSRAVVIAARGERLALIRLELSNEDESPGAPYDEMLAVLGIDEDGRIALQVFFDSDDMDTALAELDAATRRFEAEQAKERRLENAATRAADQLDRFITEHRWDELDPLIADDIRAVDRQRGLGREYTGRATAMAELHAVAELGVANLTSNVVATRGERVALGRVVASGGERPGSYSVEMLRLLEIDADNRIAAFVTFDSDDFDAAIGELDARYLAGEAAPYAQTWAALTGAFSAMNSHELPKLTPDLVNIDHRRGAAFAPGDMTAFVRELFDDTPDVKVYIQAVHRLSHLGSVVAQAVHGTSRQGVDVEWQHIGLFTFEGDLITRVEIFDEEDLDAALARFDELHPQTYRLENSASRITERLQARIASADWDAVAEMLADEIVSDDRRRIVNSGIRRGRDAAIQDAKAIVDVGVSEIAPTVIATRGEPLVLCRTRARVGAFDADLFQVVEIAEDDRVVAFVVFDPDDFDAAIAELDARYLSGEAADYARAWSVVTGTFASVSRNELPAHTAGCVTMDHRRLTPFAPGELNAYIRAGWELDQTIRTYVEVVHRLSDLGAVCTFAAHGSSREGFDAEWRGISLLTVDGDLVNRSELFDEADLDIAIARFDELSQPTPRLENAASQVYERCNAYFRAQDWDALAATFADDISTQDRRRVVGFAVQNDRNTVIANTRAIIEYGMTNLTSTVIATRGNRLVLARARFSGPDQEPGAFHTDVLIVLESNAENRIAAHLVFDPDDFDAALAELDARYLAGEAAPYAHTWSVIVAGHAALNRRELPPMTSGCVSIDHRRGATFGPGELLAYFHAGFELGHDIQTYVEVVHRLSDLGAVCTHVGHGISHEGFEAEWRGVDLLTVDGDMVNRCEVFDEADLDAALARFDELSRPAPRLENAASQMADRVMARFTAREWDAETEMLADDFSSDDRRRTVNAGIQRGRDVAMKDARANANLGAAEVTSTVIATRGERLVLRRARYASSAQSPEDFYVDALIIYEINGDGRLAATVVFDIDDLDAALAELDSRYLAGEAAPHAHTWSAIIQLYATVNRHQLPAMTPNAIVVDRRPLISIEAVDLAAFLRSVWELTPELSVYVEAVHRLNNRGAVLTLVIRGTSEDGSDVNWRLISIMMFEGDQVSRSEVVDEADLDTALARFDELSRPAPRLENAASQVAERFFGYFGARDWDAVAAILAEDVSHDDRRHVVNAGVLRGRDAQIANLRAIAQVGVAKFSSTVIATRGTRLALVRTCSSGQDQRPEAILTEELGVVEINSDNRMAAYVAFDTDDVDTAFEELEARYLAGEAAAHSRTWSAIARMCGAYNRRETGLTTADSVYIDHRLGLGVGAGGLDAHQGSLWDVTPDLRTHIEAVHRLSELGAVLTSAVKGTSSLGFDAEWRTINVLTSDGDRLTRCEIFDEADLDTALARFEELHPVTPRLENAASQVVQRFLTYFAGRDWDAMAELLSDDCFMDDRRRVVNAGTRHGRDAEMANLRAIADVGVTNLMQTVIAVRGDRLVLGRYFGVDSWSGHEELTVCEINADNQIVARIEFSFDDLDAAFEELDARYLAGEAAAHARTWSVITRECAAFNRHELPAAEGVFIDHRRLAPIEANDLPAAVRAIWDLTPDLSTQIETVHRLSSLGVVVTFTAHGTSPDGFAAEWRIIEVLTVDGDRINRFEFFEEEDLDAALARFEELHSHTSPPQNAAGRIFERYSRVSRPGTGTP
jgi:class 3 adenylate cyclase